MNKKLSRDDVQNQVTNFMFVNDHSMVFARPGSGKTRPALNAIEDALSEKVVERMLVVAPRRVCKTVWRQEAEKWKSPLSIALCIGELSRFEREQAMKANTDILLVNYDILPAILSPEGMKLHRCKGAVFDELSRLKAYNGKWNRAARRAKLDFSSGLTGSPTPNSMLSLFGMKRALTIPIWGNNYEKWRAKYFHSTDYMEYNWEINPGADIQLLEELAPYVFTLEDGAVALPPVVRQTLTGVLPSKLRRTYDEMRRTSKLADLDLLAANNAVVAGKLRQISAGFVYDKSGRALELSDSWRINILRDLVDEMQGQPLLCMYEWQAQQAQLREAFPRAVFFSDDIPSEEIVENWNAKRIPLLFGHPASMGHGNNMAQGGNSIAWLQPPHDAEQYEQAIGRLRRRDQISSHVYSYEIVGEGTLDEAVQRKLDMRATQQDEVWKKLSEINKGRRY